MKNFLLFNQSFGTVGSPNQTGETLTRENRIGLMSYLRRTLMLLFAVLVMSVANIGTAWGGTKYYLFTPSGGGPAHTGSLSGQFICNQSPSSDTKTIDEVSFSHCVATTANTSLGASWTSVYAGTATIDYDMKTTAATFTVYAYNANGSNYGVCKAEVEEGGTPTSFSQVGTSFNKTGQKITFNVTATKNKRVRIGNNSYGNVKFYQIVVEETGTPLVVPGESGYILDFTGKRFASKGATKTLGTIDGMSIKPNSDIKYNGAAVKLTTKGTDYISFTAASACKLKVYVSSNKTYYVANSSTGTTNAQTDTHEFDLAAGTWYINPNGNDVTVTKIEFLTTGTTWYVKGSFDGWGDGFNFTGTGTELTATVNITTAGLYEFKINNSDGNEWYGNGGNIGCNVNGWTFTNPGDNCKFFASETGNYTFTFNTSTKALSVTYPTAQGKYYYKNTSSWGTVAVYRYVGDKNNGWPGTQVVETETVCGDTYYFTYADPGTTLIFNNNDNGSQTGNMAASGNAGKYVSGTGNSWTAFPTYTVTYNKNGDGAGGAGSVTGNVPTDSNSPYACSSTVTVLGNTGSLALDGYNFTGWNTAANGSGAGYTAGNTFTISENTTLYAQWELIPTYDVIYNTNGGTGGSTASQTGNLSGAQVTTSANGFTKTGYKFKWWNTAANGSGEDFYPGEKVTIASANVNLYAQWEEVPTDWAYWVGDVAFSDNKADVTGNGVTMRLTNNGGAWNTDVSQDKNRVSRYNNTTDKHAKVLAVDANNEYLQVHFTDGSPINTLSLGVVNTDASTANGMIVIYSTTADFSSGSGEKVEYNSPGYRQATKSMTDFSPSVSNTYYYARIYRDVSTAVYGFTGGSEKTIRIYAVKAEKGQVCNAPSALTAATPTAKGITLSVTDANDVNNYEFYVSTESTAPEAGTTATHSVSSAKSLTITNLVAGTTYYAWARSVCGVSNKSGWTALTGNTFTTSTVTMTPTLTNVTHTSGATSGIGGSNYTAVFTANTGYSMPNPTVTIGGNAATSGTDYTWSVDGSVGTITIPANKINGNIDITLNSVPSAPSSAVISGTYHYFPGENISLTCTPSGNNGPTTYQWYKGGKENGNAIEGATSATYTKNSCTFDDAGSYYCKVTCNATSIWAVTNSHENYDVKILRLYVKGSKGGQDYGNVDFEKVNSTTATASISLGSNWTYGFNIADGCGHYYGNSGTMQYNSYGPWVTNQNGVDCGLTTTNAATYVFTINYSNLEMIETTVTFPSGNQESGKVIYFDNNDLQWENVYYRIGKSNHVQSAAMTKVYGTANLYQYTTPTYDNFAGWHITNAAGTTGSYSVYNTKNGTAITEATAFEGAAVTQAAVTVTPTASHATGATDENNNCEFYTYGITTGMKTQNVSITAPSNGTLTVNYVDVNNVGQAFSSGNRDLAHTCIITVTAVPAEGYAEPANVSINGASHGNRDPYTITGTTVVAATFSPASYTVTLNTNDGTINAGNVTSYTYGTGATLPTNVTKSGFTFGGWYDNSGLTGSAVTTISTTATGNKEYWAKWTEDVAPCPTGGDIFTLEMTYSGGSAVKVAANSTLAMTATHGTATGGTVTFGNQNGSSNDKMQIKKPGIAYINGDDAYIRIDFSCPIKTGDVLTFTSDENKEISFTTTDTRSTSVKTSSKKWTVTKAFNDATTLYIWRGSSSSVNLHTINIVRPLTVTFDKNGGSSVSPSSATYDGTSSCVLAETSRTDYHLDGWNTRADGSGDDLGLPGEVYHLDGVTTSTTTVYAIWSAKSCASGTLYKFQVNTGLTNGGLPHQQEVYVKTSDFLSIMTGGYLKAYNSSSSSDYIAITDNSRICIGNSSSYLLVQLDCPLRAGDKIKSTVTTQTLYVTKADVSRTNTVTLPIAANNEQTIPEALVGATELKIWSGSSNGGKISYFEIIRSASTYNVTYDGNDQTSAVGTVPTDATNYAYNATVTTAAQGSLAKTNYTFGGWNTANDGTGTNTAAGSTFSITDNTTLYAKWTQAVTLDANTANHGSAGGSATAVWNATALTGITHATPASGYKLLGYYTTDSGDGVKVLNSDGSFAATNVTYYITSGKWSRTDEAPTLYARYESSGSLIWNLGVNTDATSLTTSSKNSDFAQITVANMTNAALTGISYSKSKKSELTGIIETPTSYDGAKYVSVTFQVAAGYKFTPSSVNVKVQPKDNAKTVKLELSDASSHSQSYTSGSQSAGSIHTVTMTGNGTFYTGTVTLKIYCYGASGGYRLGTPISIEGEVEATCTMPSFDGLNYEETSYNLDDDASAITVTNPANVTSYLWKQNSTNDRSGTTPASGTNDEASYTPPTGAAGTMYYWCELTNACGTVKTPAVGITVSATKSDATISWTGTSASANYGGGGYTVKATVNDTEWNGNAADLTLSAPAGIRIYNIESGETASKKWVQASFDVTTAFDRTDYPSNIPFTVSADATSDYNAISNDHNISYSACTGGGGDATEYLMPVNADSVNSTVKGWRFAGTGKMWFGHGSSTPSTGSNIKSLSNTMAGGAINKYYNSGGSYFSFYTETAITGVRLYVYTSNSNVKVSNVYIANSQFATGTPSSGAVTYEVVYNDDNEGLDKGDNVYSAWAEITFASEVAAGKYGLIKLDNNVKIAGIGLLSGSSSGADLTTTLAFATPGPINDKTQSSVNFTNAASVTAYSETLGQITYSSSNTSCATVNPTTGEVTITASGADDLFTTITATLSASGCYKSATATYTINIPGVSCTVNHGTLSSDVTSKCETEDATLTLTDFESGASVQWYNGETPINNSSTYAITTEGTTSTMVTKAAGTYSVMVTNATCSDRSNSITISNISATASVTKIVDEWYVKNGRLTPDIELWSLSEGATLKSVAWSPDNETGLSCVARGGVIYLEGKSPSSNDSGNDIEYTLTATITDECNADHEETTKTIKITHQKNTDKHVLAFVVNGTAKGGFTAGITAAQTTSVGLYNAIAAQFDVLATNIYATDDEKKLKEYYSQFDILCITDYPNTQTKGANSKSYVDAIGSLIDIRPILTMEAFVSKLANWKAKGISGNPKSPTTRQYTMDLQCKDHEIFAGTKLTKVGEGDEAMYRVSMVDNTKEDYATLDATYGGGAHAEKDGYNYGGKPALQGFTFTQEMIDNDLLPIGLIDDGASNPLQVGIERQHNMEARLMVLGINSYAMERLTDDGERVVINALNYLMKKNAEDIADCSTSFVGGAEGAPKNWDNKDNWTGNTVPLPSQKVRILAECEVSSTVYAQSVLIVTGGKYNHGSDDAAGKLTIKENGALIVGGKIQAASAPAYNRTRATTPDTLLIETSSTNQAALIFDNEEAETQATVKLYSLGRKPSSYQYQYFAVPMEVVPVNPTFANETHGGTGIYTYVYDEATSGWTRRKYYDDLFAFEGLGITTKSTGAMTYTMTGNLASTATKEITLTHDGAGLNLIGNSWMAPIQIGALAEDNTDANITKTVYIYCAGRDAVEGAATSGVTETAGQWIAIPFEAAEFETWKATGKLSVIPAMQAFQIKVSAEATLTLDYKKVVRGSTNDLNAKLRAPGRRMAANEVTMTNIRVADSKTHTDLSLFEGDRFSEAFDNGWEAEYMNGDGRSAKLYAETEAGQMAVAAMYDYEGTVVGFAPGQETEYTFSFMGEDNGYYLNDIKLQNSVRISEGETYTFTYEEGDAANRFYISRTAINAPSVTTGMENLDAAAPRVQKIIYNDKLYIIRGGRLYDATGKVVK